MTKSEYKQQLSSPMWKARRLEILKRDNFTCQKCGDTKKTLSVHHTKYIDGLKAWEYDDFCLQTLCSDCHVSKHKKEGNYVKIYLNTALELIFKCKGDLSVFISLLKIMDYDNITDIPLRKKHFICSDCGMAIGSVSNSISRLKKSGIIAKITTSSYMINPKYATKSSWDETHKLQYPPIQFTTR